MSELVTLFRDSHQGGTFMIRMKRSKHLILQQTTQSIDFS